MKKNWLIPTSSTAQRGQVLLIVVLVMVVALTVGLSVATRSITNLRTTTEEDNSQRAFSAAEAGIERVLKTHESSITTPQSLQNNANIKNVQVTDLKPLGADPFLLRNTAIEKNVGYDVWFVPHTAAGVPIYGTPWSGSSLTFYWGATNANPCTRAALEIIFITGSVTSPTTIHQVYDPCDSRGTSDNHFVTPSNPNFTTTTGTDVSTSVKLYNKVVINGTLNNLLLARVTPLYADALIAVQATSLPSQGSLITSTGESGETFRKIEVNNPFPQVPTELYSVLFAPNNHL